MTLSRSNPRAGKRWMVLVAAVATLTLFGAMLAQAALSRTLFELDKDAVNNNLSVKIGVLNAAVSNAASANSIDVCQDAATAYTGTVLIDAEKMTLGAKTNLGGGGCPAGYTNKVRYAVTRTTRGAHAKAEDVTLLVPNSASGSDWDQVYAKIAANAGGSDAEKCDSAPVNAVECAFTHDGRAMSIFTSSKDYDPLNLWQWRDQSVPDADELDDGFAVKYVDGSGAQHLYFGADRFAANGSKDAGFWFFHDDVGTVAPVGTADGTFDGVHTAPVDNGADGFCNPAAGGQGGPSTTPACAKYDTNDTGGDVLVLTTFTGGGATTTIRVFEWIGPGGSTGSLLARGSGASADCQGAPNTVSICATVNNTTIESPWPYSGKGEPATNEIPSGGFLEGGINLTDLGLEGCFSSFMATTRSAPSLTADPKDFILGNFEACSTTLTTTPADDAGTPIVDTNDNDVPDVQLGTGNAGVDVTDAADLTINGTPNWSGTLDFYLCGPSVTTCDADGVAVDSQSVDQDTTQPIVSATAHLTSAGTYCWAAFFTSDDSQVPDADDSTSDECFEVLPVTASLDTHAVDSVGADLADSVPFGDPVYDKASLSGTAYEPGIDGDNATYPSINATMDTPAKGTISFTLVGPDGDTADCTTVASGTGDNPESVTVDNGDGDYFSTGFTPDLPGVYHWIASYDGDSPNTVGTDHNTACDDTDEDVTVQQLQPTIGTEQSFVPNDSATVTVDAGAGDLDGYLVFNLYVNDTDCSGTAAYTSDHIALSDPDDPGDTSLSASGDSANADAYSTDGTTFNWIVEFHSNNSAHLGVTSACTTESSSITIDNDGPDAP